MAKDSLEESSLLSCGPVGNRPAVSGTTGQRRSPTQFAGRRRAGFNMKAVPHLLARLFPLAILLHAQTPIENTGAPMRIPFECTHEDTQLAGLTCSDE